MVLFLFISLHDVKVSLLFAPSPSGAWPRWKHVIGFIRESMYVNSLVGAPQDLIKCHWFLVLVFFVIGLLCE